MAQCILFPEDVFEEGCLFMKVKVSNGLCIIHTTREYLREVSHEDIETRGEGGVEVRVEEEKVR